MVATQLITKHTAENRKLHCRSYVSHTEFLRFSIIYIRMLALNLPFIW